MSNPRRLCKNNPNELRYIYGELTLKKYRKNLNSKVKSLYHVYFGCAIGDQSKYWAPNFFVWTAVADFTDGLLKNVCLGFKVPMVWRKQKDHVTDCYLCLTNVQGHSLKTRKNIQYQDLPSAIRPVQHSVDLSIPMPPASLPILDKESLTCFESSGADFEPCQNKGIPHLITQEDLNNLVRNLFIFFIFLF